MITARVAKVMFSQASVCPTRGGVTTNASWDRSDGHGAGGHLPPQMSTPPILPPPPLQMSPTYRNYGQCAGSTHPTGMHTCYSRHLPCLSAVSHPGLLTRNRGWGFWKLVITPANEVWGKVTFLYPCVILFTRVAGGGYLERDWPVRIGGGGSAFPAPLWIRQCSGLN